MSALRFLVLPILIGAVAVIYLIGNGGGDVAGAVMLLVFALASGFFSWILVPTFDHEGNTAPIDPDFEDPGR